MRPLTITLPPDLYARVRSGERRHVAHRRNPRIDRYFTAKMPGRAEINGVIYPIAGIEETPTEWIITLKGA